MSLAYLLVLVLGTISASTLKFIVDKEEDIHKLGPSPVLTYHPLVNSTTEDLKNTCSIRQSKLLMYLPIPFYRKLPLSSEGNPFVQVINLDQKTLILYRQERSKDVSSMLVSTLPNTKLNHLGLIEETKNLTDAKLAFKIDLSLPTSTTFKVYLMTNNSHILAITLDSNTMTIVKKEGLDLAHPCPKRAFWVYESKIYILEPKSLFEIKPDLVNFSKYTSQEIKFNREYSSFAIVNGTFVFVRGYSTLVISPSHNPEDSRAIVYPETFSHGILKYSGFNNFVLSSTTGETGDRDYHFFKLEGPETLQHFQRLKLSKLQGSATPMVRGLIRLVQYKEAMYYIYPKKVALEYFDSNTPPVEMIKNTFGAVLGVIGPYNRTVDSIHPLEGYRIGLSNRLRLRKLYTNSLQSELICRRPKGLKSPRILRASIATRKNTLDVEVVFVEEQTHVIPPPPKPVPHYGDVSNPTAKKSSFEKVVLYTLLTVATAVILILICLLRQARKNKKTLMKQIHDIMSGTPGISSSQTDGSLELSQSQNESTDKPNNQQHPAQEALSDDMTL